MSNATREEEEPPASVRVAIVGCGDVVFRRYLPSLKAELHAGRVRVVACCDPRIENARRLSEACEVGNSQPRPYERLDDVLDRASEIDALLNLTPPAKHYDISSAGLLAGFHVFSEKPLASTATECQELAELARRGERVLQCAPAVMATARFRWVREVIASGRIGTPTLATGQIANLGPAGWRPYTGDPRPFYGAGTGPLLDEGIYLLHGITGMLGPAKRVQAFGGISIPRRTILGGPHAGGRVEVATADHVLLHLQFEGERFAQILSSYAVPASRVPTMEVHGSSGTISIVGHLSANAPVDVFVADDSALGLEGWMVDVGPVPLGTPSEDLVGAGAVHFIACLLGEAAPILTAAHAGHVLDITAKAAQSMRDGQAVSLETGF